MRRMTQFGIAAVMTLTVVAGTALAQGQKDHGMHMMNHDNMKTDQSKMGDMQGGGLSSLPSVEGEVRRVDQTAGKVTLRHGEIKQLEMPPMTMVFEVRDKSLLDGFKAGDKVKFKVINENGKMIVTEIKAAN